MKTGNTRVGLVKYSALPKKAALYTMKTSSEQRLTSWRSWQKPRFLPAGLRS